MPPFRRPFRPAWGNFVALVVCILALEGAYRWVVRPHAAEVDSRNRAAAARAGNEAFIPERSPWVVIRDLEQQACFTLFAWALFLIAARLREVQREGRALLHAFPELDPGERILPDDAPRFARQLDTAFPAPATQPEPLLAAALRAALLRFHATRSVQDAAQCLHARVESEFNRLDASLSLLRYLAWSIPSIGFIGTVRGIGLALGQADQAIKGDVSGVTASLGLAFNSTFIALILSIVLMFFLHHLQGRQDQLLQGVEDYARERLLGHLKVPAGEPHLPLA